MIVLLLATLWAGYTGSPVHACDMRATEGSVFIDRTPRRDDGSLSLYVVFDGARVVAFDISTSTVLPEGCTGTHTRVEP